MKGINTSSISCPIPVYNMDSSPNEAGQISEVVDVVLHYKTHSERTLLTVSSLGRQNMILGYIWLKDHNPEVNWQTREVQMNRCPSQCEECCVIRKEQVSRKRMETRALNVCWSGPFPEYAEDSEENEAPVWTHEAEYEPGDQLFMTRILLDSTAEDLHAASTTFQKLVEGACQSAEAWKEPFILSNCVRGFESIFAKKDFDVVTLLENFLWKCNMGYTLYLWISLLESTLETSYKPQT